MEEKNFDFLITIEQSMSVQAKNKEEAIEQVKHLFEVHDGITLVDSEIKLLNEEED